MNAYVTNPLSLLGNSLAGALRWEGHSLAPSIAEAGVVFDTANGVIYRKDRALARFVFGELLGPEHVTGTAAGEWLVRYMTDGRSTKRSGGAWITDARDVALAMIAAADRGLSGEFHVVGPFYTFEELVDLIEGVGSSRPSVALPELGISFRPAEETLQDAVASLRNFVERMVV